MVNIPVHLLAVMLTLPGPPGDEGDVEVVWHRASGRASTPPLGPPGDTYDPFQVGLSSLMKVFKHNVLHQPSEDEPPAPRGPPAPTFGPRGGLPPLPGEPMIRR